jgi:hypothetical protein
LGIARYFLADDSGGVAVPLGTSNPTNMLGMIQFDIKSAYAGAIMRANGLNTRT